MAALVERIVVSRADVESETPWRLVDAVIHFVRLTSIEGLYEASEYHPDAIGICHLASYLGQVSNGGHEQFAANVGWKQDVNDHIERVLRTIGAVDAADLFHAVRSKVDGNPQLLEGMKRRGGFNLTDEDVVDSWLSTKDSELYRLNAEHKIYRLGSEYIRRHPALDVVEGEELDARLRSIAQANPMLAERRAERERKKVEGELKYLRKLRLCEILSGMLGEKIEATRGFVIQATTDSGEQVDATIHETDAKRQVAYIEIDGKAIIASYPDAETLAEISLGPAQN